MIKVDNGTFKMEASNIELSADLALAIYGVNEYLTRNFGSDFAKNQIYNCVRLGMQTKEETASEAKAKKIIKSPETIKEILRQMGEHTNDFN